jgi:hypothetical protein
MNKLLVFIASVTVAFVMISCTASANASSVMAAVHAGPSRPDTTASRDGGIASWRIMPSESLSGSGLEAL